MRGSPVKQVQDLFHQSGINQIGTSKHMAKSNVREDLRQNDKSASWHNVGKKMGIHSYSTADAYRKVWIELHRNAKENFGVKNIENLKGEHTQHYLEGKISNNVAHSTFMQYASACEKLEQTLNLYAEKHDTGNTYHFSSNIQNARSDAHKILERFEGSRAYETPSALVNSVKGEVNNIAAHIQYEAGARINETYKFKEENLKGLAEHSARGEVGKIFIDNTKGGKERDIFVTPETYQRLENYIKEHGEYVLDKSSYYISLNDAAKETNQTYNASHGLRWSFAREEFQKFMETGRTYEETLILVSDEMGHVRGDITEHYLK
ncbi:Integrase, catalytic core, phage domain protein [Candidatus Magnetomorum sp. HK-1]|nr:Integrase, catalytic core, phage domain protein [Candidatus Magnetomorum sp. HK-1]